MPECRLLQTPRQALFVGMGQGIDRHVQQVLIANAELQSGISLNSPQALRRTSRLLQRRAQATKPQER